MSKRASACCSGLGSSDTHFCLLNLWFLYTSSNESMLFLVRFTHVCYPQASVLVHVAAGWVAAHFNVYFWQIYISSYYILVLWEVWTWKTNATFIFFSTHFIQHIYLNFLTNKLKVISKVPTISRIPCPYASCMCVHSRVTHPQE